MAHIHKKIKKGRPYYYVRETARVDGKPKVVNQVYLGSPEKIMELATKRGGLPEKLQVQEFGALWLAHLIEQEIGLAGLVDTIVPVEKEKNGPSVGEYFVYAVYNRMIDACSKRAMPDWYRNTAIQCIRPVKVDDLNSQLFWKIWDSVGEKQLEHIADTFLSAVAEVESSSSDCFLFDTTNYYTFMSGSTKSQLAMRGKNKEGRHWLRQVGVALLVSRDKRLPLYYKEYEGNRHDSKVFLQRMEDILAAIKKRGNGEMTVVFDKGMNSQDNIAILDSQDINFITTYSTYYSEDLIHIGLDRFTPVATEKNLRLLQTGKDDDQLVAWRTEGEYWGKTRTVVVTYNPLTATRQRYNFEKKLLQLQEQLFEMQDKVNAQATHWKKKSSVVKRYEEICSGLHIPTDLYTVELSDHGKGLWMNFRKNHYRIGRYIDRFGKNIIVTNITEWATDEIVQASLDRWMVEDSFRQSKDDDLVAMMPMRHWTDSKIRCHLFTCIAVFALLRIIEIRLRRAGLNMTAKAAMKKMQQLHSCLIWLPGKRKATRMIEEPDNDQAKILRGFGWKIAGGVLQEN
jgi:transposase